jgi:hypothetical protein
MVSWCDPELIPKGEWDSEFAEPIMAGRLASDIIHLSSACQYAGRRRVWRTLAEQGTARAIHTVISICPPGPCSVCPAGQLPGATAAEIRKMNLQLALFHDLTSG